MGEMAFITTEELYKKMTEGVALELVDVREDEEIAEGIIPGAKHIRMMDIPTQLDYFDSTKEYIFICRSGNRSAYVCQYMQDQGFKVRNLVGGMLEWKWEVK